MRLLEAILQLSLRWEFLEILIDSATGVWSTQRSSMLDLTDITFDSNSDKKYLASFGYGVEEWNTESSVQIFDETNSSLVNTNSPDRFVTDNCCSQN